MKEKILLVEDQPDFQATVMLVLGHHYDVRVAATAVEAADALAREAFRLVLLDLELPDQDGLSFLTTIRDKKLDSHTPVVLLTASSQTSDKVKAFGAGAVDYIVKPFEPDEFRARVDAHVRRAKDAEAVGGILRRGRLILDPVQKTCLVIEDEGSRSPLPLTPFEFEVLHYLSNNEDKIISREQLLTSVWKNEVHVLSRTVDRHISSLRKKLNSAFGTLEAVHGRGYRLSLRKDN